LNSIPIVAHQAGGVVDREVARERVRHALIHLRPLSRLDEAFDLFLGDAGHPPDVRRDGDRYGLVVPIPPDPDEVEALVYALLEIDRLAPAVGVPLGQLREPLGPHPDVGDLVGEDELDGALETRVTDLPPDVDQLVE